MKTKCPECQTLFNVNEQQLEQRDGMVRCGRCRHVFNAWHHIQEDDFPVLDENYSEPYGAAKPSLTIEDNPPPPLTKKASSAQADTTPSHEPSLFKTRQSQSKKSARQEDIHLSASQEMHPEEGRGFVYLEPEDYADDTEEDEVFLVNDGRNHPRFYNRKPPKNRHGVKWFFASILLLLVLVLQVVYVFRNQLANQFPNTQPYIVQVCDFLNCHVKISPDISKVEYENLSLKVRPDIKAEDDELALLLSVRISNRDLVEVPWPSLVLELKDENDAPDFVRIIKPEEYLPDDFSVEKPMSPGARLQLNLPITVKSKDVHGYDFSLFFP